MEIRNNLSKLRKTRGIEASKLAAAVGVSRQTIYAIEAGTYVPNTIVSLKLALALETPVETIFQIEPEPESPSSQQANVLVLGDPASLARGDLLRIVKVNGQLVAVIPDGTSWGLQSSDAAFLAPISRSHGRANARVTLFGNSWENPGRILLAGCDPSASLLANTLQRQGFEVVIAFENSANALKLLRGGLVHVAGTHLADSKINLKSITRIFPRGSIAIFTYAMWNEGLAIAPENPKHIAGILDLARKEIEITNREPGAGCRYLLDDLLKKNGISTARIKGYDRITQGQLPAARLVKSGEVDCCINTQAAASSLGLAFVPLIEKPYLLVIRRTNLKLAAVQALIEILGRAAFRREVESCAGYDMRTAGDRLI